MHRRGDAESPRRHQDIPGYWQGDCVNGRRAAEWVPRRGERPRVYKEIDTRTEVGHGDAADVLKGRVVDRRAAAETVLLIDGYGYGHGSAPSPSTSALGGSAMA